MVRQRVGGPIRRQPRAVEHVVGQQVADAGDLRLIHESGLERRRRRREDRTEGFERDRRRIRAEPGLVRIELNATESTGVTDDERSPLGEVEPEAIPRRIVAIARILERRNRGSVVHEDPARHAITQTQHRPVGVDEHQLADPPGAGDAQTRKLGTKGVGRRGALGVPLVGRMNGGNRAADHRISSEPILLDLQHLGHRWPVLLGSFLGGAQKRVGDERAEERRLEEEAVVALWALDDVVLAAASAGGDRLMDRGLLIRRVQNVAGD